MDRYVVTIVIVWFIGLLLFFNNVISLNKKITKTKKIGNSLRNFSIIIDCYLLNAKRSNILSIKCSSGVEKIMDMVSSVDTLNIESILEIDNLTDELIDYLADEIPEIKIIQRRNRLNDIIKI